MLALAKRLPRAWLSLPAGLLVVAMLSGCAPGASNVAIVRPSHAANVRCSASHTYDARAILGLSEREAKTIVGRWGCALRVSERDGASLAGTPGVLSRRVNVEVKEGLVVRITSVG
jgi:L,D-peptidoglycan transpeptidase YkuD (ErfK/YbiS/YcfS/YnhG family)